MYPDKINLLIFGGTHILSYHKHNITDKIHLSDYYMSIITAVLINPVYNNLSGDQEIEPASGDLDQLGLPLSLVTVFFFA